MADWEMQAAAAKGGEITNMEVELTILKAELLPLQPSPAEDHFPQ